MYVKKNNFILLFIYLFLILAKVFHRLSGINPKMMRLVKSAIEKAKITDEYDPLDVSDSVFDTETNELVDDKKKTVKKYYFFY